MDYASDILIASGDVPVCIIYIYILCYRQNYWIDSTPLISMHDYYKQYGWHVWSVLRESSKYSIIYVSYYIAREQSHKI